MAHLGKSESTWPDEAKTQSKSRFYEEDVFIHSFLFSSHCDIFVRKIRANRMGMGRKKRISCLVLARKSECGVTNSDFVSKRSELVETR